MKSSRQTQVDWVDGTFNKGTLVLVVRISSFIIACLLGSGPSWAAVNNTLLPAAEVAAEGEVPLNFQDWKGQQVREAQGALERANGERRKAVVAPKGSTRPLAATELPTSQRIHVNDSGAVAGPQARDVRAAQETLQYAYDLGIEEYITVYLVQFKDDVRALAMLMQKLSPQESALLVQTLMREKERRSEAGVVSLPTPVISQLQGVGGLISRGAQRKSVRN